MIAFWRKFILASWSWRDPVALLMLSLFAMFGTMATVAARAAPLSSAARPEAEIRDLSKQGAGSEGMVGVAAWRLDGLGPRVLINADRVFPMASTFKVAVAGRVLERVDKRELKLD